MAHLTKCPACGCTDFLVHQDYVWVASVTYRGVLVCTNPDEDVSCITCEKCAAEYRLHDFTSIHFT